jgi:hypothetical protein
VFASGSNQTAICANVSYTKLFYKFKCCLLIPVYLVYVAVVLRITNSGNACYQSAQNLLSSRLLSKNVKLRIYRTTILPVVLYGCETWSLTLRESHRLMTFENRVPRRIFGRKKDGENCIMRRFVTYILRQVQLEWSYQGGWDGQDM